jgi:hypothetical protein
MNFKSLQLQPQLSYDQANIINEFRLLLSQVTYLFRFYIVASIDGIGNSQDIANEILKLPLRGNELVNSINGFNEDFTPITEAYITGLKNLIGGMLSGDQDKANESIRQLYEIADQNARQLAQLSPYWDEDKWRDLFYVLNRDLVAEVIAIESGDYNKALDIFEISMEEALKRADYYAEGVINFLPEDQQNIPIAYFNMIKDFRELRTEWSYLTRFYIVAKILGLGDDAYVTQRFFDLVLRMEEKFELILGTEIADELYNLLSIYAIRVEELINAILSGDTATIEAQTNALRQYDDNLAVYLGSINPYWDEAIWKDLLNTTAELIIKESNELYTKDYTAAALTFEELLYASLVIGDYFALGLYQYALI